MRNQFPQLKELAARYSRVARTFLARSQRAITSVVVWRIPQYGRRALYTQAAVVIGAAYFLQSYPLIPGVAIGLLGFVAALMSLEVFNARERLVWTIFIFALFMLEMRVIYADRTKFENEQAELRIKEDIARKSERDSFAALLMQGKSLFENEERLSEKERNQITGGNTFCYLDFARGVGPELLYTF